MRDPEEKETVVFLAQHHRHEQESAALEKRRVMELIRDWGVDVATESGAAGLCATGHLDRGIDGSPVRLAHGFEEAR